MAKRTNQTVAARRVTPRVLGAATVTIVGGVVMVNGQPVSAATISVTNTDDAGAGSLRQAVADAATGDTIDLSGVSGTIALTTGPINVNGKELTITGPGQAVLTLTNATGDVLYVNNADLYLSNVTIDGAGDDGIEARLAGDITLNSVTISNSVDHGIDVYAIDTLTVIDSIMSGNGNEGIDASDVREITIDSTTVSKSFDKGIDVDSVDTFSVTDSFVYDSGDEGIQASNVSEITIDSVTVSNNFDQGIDIRNSASVTVISSTVSGGSNDGVEATNSNVSIQHSTIVDNASYGIDSGSGYGYDYSVGESVIAIDHVIVSGNTNGDFGGTGAVTANHSLLDTGSALSGSGTGNVEADDPLLAPLADNGGTTPTRLPLELSPAINAGDPAIAGAPATDQRGSARIVQTIDIGAVEVDAGQVDISPATVTVAESAGTVAITVTRTGQSDGEASVTVMSIDGTASAPGDYTAVSQVVTWANGESGPKVVNVPIADDDVIENDETFTVSLSSPTGGVRIGADTTTVTITDDAPTATTTTTIPTPPTSTTTATIPTPPTTEVGGGPVTLPSTGDDTTGRIVGLGGIFLALGAVAARLARRPRTSA